MVKYLSPSVPAALISFFAVVAGETRDGSLFIFLLLVLKPCQSFSFTKF
jgi:hypothetical protein